MSELKLYKLKYLYKFECLIIIYIILYIIFVGFIFNGAHGNQMESLKFFLCKLSV